MTRALTDQICAALPGVHWASHHDGGLDAWKVGDKMFACIGMANDGVSLKCATADDAALLIDMGQAIRAPYFHRSWVRLPWGICPTDEWRDRVMTSYRLIRAGLPKKLKTQLDDI